MMTYSQLKSSIPLYSDLACLILAFLEPCVDYDVPQCAHIQCVVCNRHVGEIRQGGGCTLDVCRFCGILEGSFHRVHHSRHVSAQDLKIIKFPEICEVPQKGGIVQSPKIKNLTKVLVSEEISTRLNFCKKSEDFSSRI